MLKYILRVLGYFPKYTPVGSYRRDYRDEIANWKPTPKVAATVESK